MLPPQKFVRPTYYYQLQGIGAYGVFVSSSGVLRTVTLGEMVPILNQRTNISIQIHGDTLGLKGTNWFRENGQINEWCHANISFNFGELIEGK